MNEVITSDERVSAITREAIRWNAPHVLFRVATTTGALMFITEAGTLITRSYMA